MQAVDVLIVGSGLAGLRLALALPETVTVAWLRRDWCKTPILRWAQGVLQRLGKKMIHGRPT